MQAQVNMLSLATVQMWQVGLFIAISAGLTFISMNSLRTRGSHGFYRFFVWEADAALFVIVAPGWFDDFFSLRQLTSSLLLTAGAVLVIEAVRLLKVIGESTAVAGSNQYQFENTTQLVVVGLYRYIRHPMYSSLLFLTWGLFLRGPTALTALLALVATAFLVATARADEQEDIVRFGDAYREYMEGTKRFIPFVW